MRNKMISVATGFQYSVNIGYDLNSDEKLLNFIPTNSSLELLEDVLMSTNPTSTDRARVLIGPYGKGKSHIVLTILALLMKRNRKLFVKTMPKIEENLRLKHCVDNYYKSENKILPVIITGSNTSLSQAFLLALQRTLSMNGLDVMPETNYKAAVQVIAKWEKEFPKTYNKLKRIIGMPIKKFVLELQNYNSKVYETFERIYPELTAGSVFNPFIGFDVVELYEEALKGLKRKGYTGIYVIYDEFSKFLEANITEASVSDTKMLQDFAEKCNRSGDMQMHIMLISHKEISNYIDKLPKNKVDGWRGVSERFKHIHLNNSFTQTYDIISSAIQKEEKRWSGFKNKNKTYFSEILAKYKKHNLFSDLDDHQIKNVVFGCYPLHPVSTFILPRLSERVAQNERTLFTFISASGGSTLQSYLETHNEDNFGLITPDMIYDYFEPLLQKEVYGGVIQEYYYLTEIILEKLYSNSLEAKIVKTLSLIYILEQFEKLQPSIGEIIDIFSFGHDSTEIRTAIDNLIEKEFVIYLKRSNNLLRLKQTSGVDIKQKIRDTIEIQRNKVSIKETLNSYNFDNCMYPSRYNNERDMVRYFSFEFIDEDEISDNINWKVKSSDLQADGVIYGVVPHSKASIEKIKKLLIKSSKGCENILFVIPRVFTSIEKVVRELNAVALLRDEASDEKVLFEEYDVIYDDLSDVVSEFIRNYTRPEKYKATFIFKGSELNITRKSVLSEFLSEICDEIFSKTPIINNESINKNTITSTAAVSRGKVVSALLRNELEPNLGLMGSGQDVSIMRSTLLRTNILEDHNGVPVINLKPSQNKLMAYLLSVIEQFVCESKKGDGLSFAELYRRLQSSQYNLGLRSGIIPIYIATVLHKYKKEAVISDGFGQVPINADTLSQINAKPDLFKLSCLDWDESNDKMVERLGNVFSEYVVDVEKHSYSYDYVVSAMRRWYISLPKYTRESSFKQDGESIPKEYLDIMKLLKSNISGNDFLFVKMPKILGKGNELKEIKAIKTFYDGFLGETKKWLANQIKDIFIIKNNKTIKKKASLSSVIKDWCETISPEAFNQLFDDGTERMLSVFKNITNDDDTTIDSLAKIATDLRIEDWDEKIKLLFIQNIKMFKNTAESFKAENIGDKSLVSDDQYQITFTDEKGRPVIKRFNKVERTNRGKLLHNQVTAALDSMGRSITDQEKRQILIDILKDLC